MLSAAHVFPIRSRTVLLCMGAAAIIITTLAVTYLESLPNQIPGTSAGDRMKTLYFAVKNAMLDESPEIKGYTELQKSPVYKKFKSMYPNSTDEFRVAIDGSTVLTVSQHDIHGNRLELDLQHKEGFVYRTISCLSAPDRYPKPDIQSTNLSDLYGYDTCLLD